VADSCTTGLTTLSHGWLCNHYHSIAIHSVYCSVHSVCGINVPRPRHTK